MDDNANGATAVSMLSSALFVVLAFRLNLDWLNSLYMVLIGLGYLALSNLVGLALLRPALNRKIWAVYFTGLFCHLLPFYVGLYFAGIFVLIIKSGIFVLSFIWNLF